MLETVMRVLEEAKAPMQVRAIHEAACEIVGETLLWRSVKAALAANITGEHHRSLAID